MRENSNIELNQLTQMAVIMVCFAGPHLTSGATGALSFTLLYADSNDWKATDLP